MKQRFNFVIWIGLALITACSAKRERPTDLNSYPLYEGEDLELTYTPEASRFAVWSPAADEVMLYLYEQGEGGNPYDSVALKYDDKGVWRTNVKGDLNGKYYTFRLTQEGKQYDETPGIWAKAVGVNGNRAAILDLRSTDPQGWSEDKRPPLASFNDIVIYEMHHRDLSIAPNSGNTHKGKFLALTEEGTKSPEGLSTGIDHLKELGITHVHLLPSYDYGSIDETRLDDNRYNWGYDPKNYNVPEGGYATDPYRPGTRIKEFKEMVQSLHKNGIRVIMDVVYNHTYVNDGSNFSLTVPRYFYRHNPDGSYSDASGCGNETASERVMMRRYIIESVKHWIREYHVDGFRFDLMGIHDIETMNELRKEVDAIDSTIFIYGEGWTAGASPLEESLRAVKKHAKQMTVAVFSDDLRDALKGHFADGSAPGFVTGAKDMEQSVRFGVVGAIDHPQIDYTKVNYSKAAYTNSPSQVINYVSCHDDMCLVDKLKASTPKSTSEEQIKRYDRLAQTVVFTAQGVPFIYAGEELFRNKKGIHNTFQSPDSINQIDWSFKAKHHDLFEYYRNLIAMRRAHPAFRMSSGDQVRRHLNFIESPTQTVAYTIDGSAVGDSWSTVAVIYNGKNSTQIVEMPVGNWTVVCLDGKINLDGLAQSKGGKVTVPASSAWIAFQ